MKKLFLKVSAGLSGALASVSAFALDTTATNTAITGAQTDIESVAVAIISVAAVMFGIAKIRQVIKA